MDRAGGYELMSYVRLAANLIIDNADADGRITVMGVGRDWEATEPRDETIKFTPDIGSAYAWEYNGLFEYIDRLNGIAPLGTYTPGDMSLAGWTQTSGSWGLSSAANATGYRFLQYYDDTGAIGRLTSTGNYSPNLAMWIWRFPGTGTIPALLGLHFLGSAGAPEYAIYWPAQTEWGAYEATLTGQSGGQYTSPLLLGRPQSESVFSVIDRQQSGGTLRLGDFGAEPVYQVLKVEYLDGYLLVRSGDQEAVWEYGGEWTSAGGKTVDFALGTGPIEFRVIGQPAMINVQQLTYPASAIIKPRLGLGAPAEYEQTPSYRILAGLATGTAITAASETMTPAEFTRPAVTFTTSDTSNRAILYCVQEYRAATIGAADSNPVNTQDFDALRLVGISGHLDDRWRGATVEGTIRAAPGVTLATNKPNTKVAARLSGDAGASWTTMFTGYSVPPGKAKSEGVQAVVAEIQCVDIIGARLQHKQMGEHCSYEAWVEKDAWEYILTRAGVPAALQNIDATFTGLLPTSKQKGARKLRFTADTGVISALDTLAEVRGRRWGVGYDGVVFVGEPLTHTAADYDFTVDEDTATLEDVVNTFSSEQALADFANLLRVMVAEGADAAAKQYINYASITDATAADFIGDIWEKYSYYPDGDDVSIIGDKLWAEVAQFQQAIRFEMTDHPEYLPDMYVQVDFSNVDIVTNSIFRVTDKSWSENDGRYRQTLEAVLVEAGT